MFWALGIPETWKTPLSEKNIRRKALGREEFFHALLNRKRSMSVVLWFLLMKYPDLILKHVNLNFQVLYRMVRKAWIDVCSPRWPLGIPLWVGFSCSNLLNRWRRPSTSSDVFNVTMRNQVFNASEYCRPSRGVFPYFVTMLLLDVVVELFWMNQMMYYTFISNVDARLFVFALVLLNTCSLHNGY